jgi:hypothetical protein
MKLFSSEPWPQGAFVQWHPIQDELEGFRAEVEILLPWI